MSQAVERIRQAATRKPQEKLTALLHHITTDALRCAFFDLKKTASAGVDGMVWSEYEAGLDERLLDLHDRVHSGAQGTPQGAVVSPILANVYLHYVLDLWFQKKWRARKATGDTIIVRYADDFVVGCQRKEDAEQFLCALKERLGLFALDLHPDKTRLIEFGRFAMANRRARGDRRPETFDFLGFTHYCRKTRNGGFGLGRKPIAKRATRTLKRLKERLRGRMHDDVHETAQWLGKVVNGWLNYYAVPTSSPTLGGFVRRLEWIRLKTLRRRSQKTRTTMADVTRLKALYWPPVRVRHPWPATRFAVNHPR